MADSTGPQGPVTTSVLLAEVVDAARVQSQPSKGAKPKPRRPNFNQIHAQLLPLTIYPLPPLIPHNPFSWIHIAYVYLRQLFWTPSSFPDPKHIGVFSHETGSVHVTDPRSVRALWEHGFFGKGSLSRSEPTWLDREKRKRGILAEETSEEWTRKRREERRMFKMERARKERETIDETLKKEQNGTLKLSNEQQLNLETTPNGHVLQQDLDRVDSEHQTKALGHGLSIPNETASIVLPQSWPTKRATPDSTADLEAFQNEEHLQLTLEEALFLSTVGVLTIIHPTTHDPVQPQSLLPLFISHFPFPPLQLLPISPIDPSSPFLISYIAYHHFRSLGWVVRPGVKFSVDYLLYLRGPVFAHAEFAVIVLPAYTDPYWMDKGNGREGQKPWHTLHMFSRVQAQVRKTLVLCYIEVPPPLDGERVEGVDLEGLLKRYKVREFVVRRWIPNRMRD